MTGDAVGADLRAMLRGVADAQGYAGAVYLHLGHMPNVDGSTERSDPRRLVATPRFDEDQYVRRNYLAQDPIVRRAATSYSPFPWRLSELAASASEPCAVHAAMASWGLHEGVAAPVQDYALGPAVLNFYGPVGAHPPDFNGLTEAAVQVHGAATAGCTGGAPKDATQLARREMEVLRSAALGWTEQETAMRLGLSRRGVQFHLARAMEKLQTSNKTAAVARAVSAGLIRI